MLPSSFLDNLLCCMGLDHLCSTGGLKITVNLISIDPCITVHVLQLCRQGIVSSRNTWEPRHCWSCVFYAVGTNRKLLAHCQHWDETCWYTCPRDECDISTLLKLHCLECSALVFSPEFWSWKFGSPGPKFSAEKWSPWTHLFSKSGHTPWNLVWVMQSGKPVVVATLNTCKEVYFLSTAPTFPHILVRVWSLSLTCWELLSWDSARH